VIFSKVTGIDVNELDKYLGIIAWSMFLPIILFFGALQLWPNKQLALLTAAIPNLFFILQYYGAQTLPITYGGLSFIFVVILWLAYFNKQEKDKKLLSFIVFFTVLMYFGYSLAFILAAIVGLLVWLLKWKRPWKYFGIGVLSLVIVGLEIAQGVNNFNLNQLSIKRFSVYLFRESHLLYYSLGEWLSFSFAGSWRLSELTALVFAIIMLIFLVQAIKGKNKSLQFLVWCWIILMVNFLLSWNLLSGFHYLGRRMDIFIVLIMLIILSWGIIHNLPKKKSWLILLIIILAVVSTMTYITGPREIAMVTADEVAATKYMWLDMAYTPQGYCSLANTWPLLALEAWSGKEIVLGNFPTDFNHQQPARVNLFEKINNNPEIGDLDDTWQLTNKESCFLMLDSTVAQSEAIEYFKGRLGAPQVFGSNLVWQF